MNILHVTTHLGGGLGKVILNLAKNAEGNHYILSFIPTEDPIEIPENVKLAEVADLGLFHVILVHYYSNDILPEYVKFLVSSDARRKVILWHHKHEPKPEDVNFPPIINTSPIQGYPFIWSVSDMTDFYKVDRAWGDDFFTIGYLGTVDYKKLHPEFIEICKRINIPNVRFLIGGHVSIDISSVSGKNDDDKFCFCGHIKDTANFFSRCDVFGYPLCGSHYGTCEQVLGEAMASGVPPVVFNNPAESYIVKDGKTGMVSRSIEEYIDNIERLYENQNLREMISNDCRERAMRLYNTEKMVQHWNFIFQMIGGR